MTKTYLILIIFVLIYPLDSQAVNKKENYFFSKVDYQQGLSKSAVLCLFQDKSGLMWFGTYDGVNCYDGKTMEVFKSDFSERKTLTNNVIHSIQQADSNCLWIITHLGVNRISLISRQVVGNYDFSGDYFLHSNTKGNTWVVAQNGFFYYNKFHRKFIRLNIPPVSVNDMDQRAFVAEDGTLWVFPQNSGKLEQFSLNSFDQDSLAVQCTTSVSSFHSKTIDYVFYQNGVFCFIDHAQDLYIYDISRRSKIYIHNLSSLIQKYGHIAGIVPFNDDIIIGFRANGLVRLRTSEKYEEEVVNRNVRIYGIYQDPRQGILWVASDGQGAIMYAKKYSIATNIMLNQLSSNLNRQVRSIMTDKFGGLWVGTKGDGLLHIANYYNGVSAAKAEVYSSTERQEALSYVKWNREFPVYKLRQSRYMNGFWVGSGEPGLFYYSFNSKKLYQVKDSSKYPAVEVHDIYEKNDSVLYAVTAGGGLHKIIIEKKNESVGIKRQKQYHFFYEQHEIMMFYPMLAVDDSILWLGSREKGLIRFNMQTEEYRVISLKEMLHKSVDDILSLCYSKDGRLYVGTTSGLVCLTFKGMSISARYIGREQGLLNDMIHGILEDGNGLLWLGTNKGLIKYNPQNGSSHTYYYSAGVQIGEFSDDAYYRCPYTGRLFFGGIDGLLYLDDEVVALSEPCPDILLRSLNIGRDRVNLSDYYVNNGRALQFKGSELSFSLSFVVPDFLYGGDGEYSYMLEGYDKQWTPFSSLSEALYSEIPSGNYLFKVRYKKDVFNTEYKYFSIPIHILPPWYRTIWMYFFYLLLSIALFGYLLYFLRKYSLHERMMKLLLNPEDRKSVQKSDSYDRDLIHRFTLIYHSCDQLRIDNLSTEQRNKNIDLIREMVLTTLFYPGILCKEDLQHCFPTQYFISGRMCINTLSIEVLRILAGQGIAISGIRSVIPEDFIFPVYKNALRCILYYCYLSIAQITKTPGITVDAKEKEGKMLLIFSAKDDTVKMLYDKISDISCSTDDKMTSFDCSWNIQLLLSSVQSVLKQLHATLHQVDRGDEHLLMIAFEPASLVARENKIKKKVLLLEDRDELIWLISDLLAEEYDVFPVKTLQLAFDKIRRSSPALLLVDMMLYAQAENKFMEYINKSYIAI